MAILFFILAAVAVAALAFIVFHSSSERAKLSESFRDEKEKLTKEYNDKLDEYQNKVSALSSEKAALESRLASRDEYEAKLAEAHEAALKAQKEAYERDMSIRKEQHDKELEQMKDAFKALSAENSAIFKNQSTESIEELLKPIREKFAEFDKSVRDSQKDAAAQSAALKENIEKVMQQSKSVGDKAESLANALTGYSKIQGDFGEMLLTDVLKKAGLQEGVHFVTQGVITDENGHEIKSETGRTMIPDVMVYYPDDTVVIIDSKVSLNAYNEYMNAASVEDKRKWAKAHVESVRKHIDELKLKDYASYVPEGRRKVNFNIMFIPMEGAFRLMLEEDPLLWQAAKDANVLVVSQMTLVIVLNMIQMAWKQANQEKNIADVYKTAEELMSQLKGWMDSYVKVGEALGKARTAYDESKKKLVDSNQSVVKKIEKLERLELSPKKAKGSLKTSSRQSGPESIIPKALAPEDSGEASEEN
ncbi:MAG: DNA recombination protein RmuC [Bacteroidales bacterium]|nr:DNA recombination protein RmuC [Bacteroidales bacterium]MCI2134411.1 DNA recombination protein RmuC [Bacteroidales bacterium]